MKSEPTTYSISHLQKDKESLWEGVRNYQARNFMSQEMKLGDEVLFYHSSCDVPGVYGLAKVVSEAQPDPTALNKKSEYYDPKATKEKPIWMCVKIQFVKSFSEPVTLEEIRQQAELKKMVLLQKGSRLSIQPVQAEEFQCISSMATATAGLKKK